MEENHMSYPLSPDIELGEVKLKVSNLTRSIAFYQEVVGLKVLNQDTASAEFSVDGNQVLLKLEEIEKAEVMPRRSAAGLYHFALLLPNREALGLALRNLIRSGIHIGQADHIVSEALYIADPDNNGIEIYADRPRETWKRDANGDYIMAADPIDWDGLLIAAGDKAWTGLPSDTIMGHVHFHVKNLEKSKEFYCDILGFDITVNASQMDALFISAGGYHHHIGLNIWAGENASSPPLNATGLAYATIIFPSHSSFEAILEQIQRAGIPINEDNKAWFVKDPSGIQLRLIERD
jgi:catechol 2,3-dioxygenase